MSLVAQTPQPSLAWQFDGTLGPYIGTVSSTTQRGTLNYVPGKYISALNIQNPTGTTSNSINWNFGTQTFSIDNGFSFSCWVRFNDLSYLTVIQQFITFYNGTSNALRIQLNVTQGLMQFQFTDSASSKNVNMFTPVAGTWYHLTCVGSNGNITAYLNGSTSYGPLAYVQSGITFNNASLGLATSSTIFPVTNADFDDFRVFNQALSAAQVNAIYQAQGMPSRGLQFNAGSNPYGVGGTVTTSGGNRIHTYTSVGSDKFTCFQSGYVQLLVIAGGGGGGGNGNLSQPGGGGGAGEVFYSASYSITPGTYTVTVGDGGAGGLGNNGSAGINGSSSVFGSISANGGGYGGQYVAGGSATVGSGGSGGGGARAQNGAASVLTAGGQGNTGGNSVTGAAGAGGGGAGSVGGSTSTTTGGTGGSGVAYSISGSSVTYGAGGNGGNRTDANPGATGTTNRGNGGGGAGGNTSVSANGGKGGSGIVIVSYATTVSVNSLPSMFGYPLFSQLSSAATSSAVGAFSLRAVNGLSTGGTAKAVQVARGAIGTFPPSALSSTAMTGQTVSGITYTVSSSTSAAGPSTPNGWNAFDKITGTNVSNYWQAQYSPAVYNTSTGVYTGSQSLGGYSGEWLKLRLSVAICLTSYSIQNRSDVLIAPKTWVLLGSNDGTNWSLVDSQIGITFGLGETKTFTTTSSVTFTYFAVVIAVTNGTYGSTCISEWVLFNNAATQDFYADRLGNLLTAPVVGQSLANWLGGATGYVTTWYDQSGRGNNATQATAANQPIIQRATKGPGYACVYTGNQWVSFGTLSTFQGTPFCISAVVTRTSNVANNGIIGLGTTSSGFTLSIEPLSATQDRFRTDFRKTTSFNFTYGIPVYVTGEGPLYPLCDYSSGFVNRIYSKAGTPAISGNGVDFLNTALTYIPSIGLSNARAPPNYYIGEIYEVLVFTNSLYDLDTSGGLVTQIYNNQLSAYGT